MKTAVAITLVICGTVLLIMPHVYSIIATLVTAQTMIHLSTDHISFGTGVLKHFNTLCVFAGMAMILAGVVGPALRSRKT